MPDYGIKKNSEGYNDPTAYAALLKVHKEEIEQQRRASVLIHELKRIVKRFGFEMATQIVLRDKKTGKEFR